MKINYEIKYKQDGDLCIITVEMVKRIINEWKKANCSSDFTVLTSSLLPRDYERYLVSVINTCRYEEGFTFPYINKMFISTEELEIIIQAQLENIFINSRECLAYISREVCKERKYRIRLANYFIEILSDLDSRIYYKGLVIYV